MIKKITAVAAAVCILIVSGAVFANAPQGKRPECAVSAKQDVRMMRGRSVPDRAKPKAGAAGKMHRAIAPKAENRLEMLQKRADALGIDITGLTLDEIKEKVKAAMEKQWEAKRLEMLQKRADALGIDITGLTLDEIKEKMMEAAKERRAGNRFGRFGKQN